MSCYNFVQYLYNDGLLNESADATYIIHLEGNGRLQHIYSQLLNYHPTNIVYILFNKGYKNCNKNIHIKIPPIDLIDAFLQVFKHTVQNKYNNILILEDDFIFNNKIKNKNIINNINNFVLSCTNSKFIYCLGILPYLLIPYDMNNYKVIASVGSHANIYSKELILYMLTVDQKTINDWDWYHNLNTTKYTYYEPLCYQLFPVTENSEHWGYFFNKSLGVMFHKLLLLFNLHRSVEPGYSIFYMCSKLIFYVLDQWNNYAYILLKRIYDDHI
jgi:hypothetical protein